MDREVKGMEGNDRKAAGQGAGMKIRGIMESDAAAFLELCIRVEAESEHMLIRPGERSATVGQQRARIAEIVACDNSIILVAEDGGELAGYAAAVGGPYRRNRHTAHLVIGIREAHCGQGLGTRFFAELEAWARRQGLRRLELEVTVTNAPAIALYQKSGFTVEGTRKDAVCVEGEYVDELYMAKILA
ncbi:MAG TPA: GNAT family protein [bacterium]|nr:GNAT family protein [bacterium]